MDASLKRDVRLYNLAGVVATLHANLFGGYIFSCYLIYILFITPEDWALVTGFLSFASVMRLASAYLTEHWRRRKLQSLGCAAVGRLAFLALLILPFVSGPDDVQFRLMWVGIAWVSYSALNALGSAASESWTADIVPQGYRGRFYSVYLTLTSLTACLIPLLAGAVVDYFGKDELPGKGELPGYVILLSVSFVLGELALLLMLPIKDRPMPEPDRKGRGIRMLADPWRHAGFRNLIVYQVLCAFGFGLIVMVFIDAYRLDPKVLDMSALQVGVVAGVFTISGALTYVLWRKIGERVGYRTVLNTCRLMLVVGFGYYLFLPPDLPWVFLSVMCVSQVWMGAASAGTSLATSVLTMDIAPEKHRSMYFAQVSGLLGLSGGLGAFCGRWIFMATNPTEPWILPVIGTKLTGLHVVILAAVVFVALVIRFFGRRIPDSRAEVAMPRIDRLLATNPRRLLPAFLPLRRKLPPEEKERHVDAMRQLVQDSPREQLHAALDHVLEDPVETDDELHGIIRKESVRTGRGVRRMIAEIGESIALHLNPARAKAAARRVEELYREGDLTGCLRALRRLARQTAERIDTPKAAAALHIIEAIVEVHLDRPEPGQDAVLLAVYAYLQMVREPEMPKNGKAPLMTDDTAAAETPAADNTTEDARLAHEIRLLNLAGACGTVYYRLGLSELLLLFITEHLKIPKETWALAASIIPVSAAFCIASAYLTEHWRRRKLLSLSCFVVSRLVILVIMLVPFVTGKDDQTTRLYWMAVALFAHGSLSALGASAWMSWVADIVPSGQRGSFYSARLKLVTTVDLLVFLSAGRVLDFFGKENRTGYLIIFGAAFVIGELDLYIHSFVADRPMPPREDSLPVWSMLAAPWRHAGFRNLMLCLMLTNFTSGLLGPFITLYRVQELGISPSTLSAIIGVFMVVTMFMFGFWRRVGDRLGYRTVFHFCLVWNAVGVVYWLFQPASRPDVFLPVLVGAQLWYGAGWAGLALATSTLILNVAPEKHRSMYLAQIATILGVMLGLGVFCGRWIFILVDPVEPVFWWGTKITGLHALLVFYALLSLVVVAVFLRRIPDARAEAALPRMARFIRTNPMRLFPMFLPRGRPLPQDEKALHVDSMKKLVGGSERGELHEALDHVLEDPVEADDELHRILQREREREGSGVRRMVREIAESAPLHLHPAAARSAARVLEQFFNAGNLAGCLETVQQLARDTAGDLHTPKATAALHIIEAIVELHAGTHRPDDEAVLLAVYAYLQMVREPEKK